MCEVPSVWQVPVPQSVPHVPQLSTFDVRSTHTPLQFVRPEPQHIVELPLV